MVCEVSNLNFTHEEGILQACAGLTSALSRNFTGGFVSGLPELFFDVALLWQPNTIGSRRTHSRKTDTSQASKVLPSWSWAGWNCQVDPWSWQSGCEYLKDGRPIYISRTVIPITIWYTADIPSPNKGRRIGSNWNKYKLPSQNPENPLLAGWSRQVCPKEITSNPSENDIPDGCGSYLFTHESDPEIKFWYPIPLLPRRISHWYGALPVSCSARPKSPSSP